jgi:hypothetical protein
MHLIVTARITPLRPGASPPPVSIPTLFTSAMLTLLSDHHEKGQSSKPAGENFPERSGRDPMRREGGLP